MTIRYLLEPKNTYLYLEQKTKYRSSFYQPYVAYIICINLYAMLNILR